MPFQFYFLLFAFADYFAKEKKQSVKRSVLQQVVLLFLSCYHLFDVGL